MLYLFISISIVLLAAYVITFKGYMRHIKNRREFVKAYDKYSETVPELQHVGTYDGVNFYLFKNPLEMPVKRSEMIELFSQFSDLNMTPDFFRKNIVDLNAALNKQDFSRAAMISQELINRTELAAHESILLQLAASMCVIDGENPRVPESKFFEKKIEIMKNNEQAKAFFLPFAYSTTKNLEKLSETDLLQYLTMQKAAQLMKSEKTSRLLTALSKSQTESNQQKPSLRMKASQSKSSSKK